jgi:Zn-finger protein
MWYVLTPNTPLAENDEVGGWCEDGQGKEVWDAQSCQVMGTNANCCIYELGYTHYRSMDNPPKDSMLTKRLMQ